MKCIKNAKTGEIRRVEDTQADNLVGVSWILVPKSEWKQAARKTEKQEVEVEKKERTLSKKATKRLKLKEKQRQ